MATLAAASSWLASDSRILPICAAIVSAISISLSHFAGQKPATSPDDAVSGYTRISIVSNGVPRVEVDRPISNAGNIKALDICGIIVLLGCLLFLGLSISQITAEEIHASVVAVAACFAFVGVEMIPRVKLLIRTIGLCHWPCLHDRVGRSWFASGGGEIPPPCFVVSVLGIVLVSLCMASDNIKRPPQR